MVKPRLAGIIALAVTLCAPCWAATPVPAAIVTPPQPKWSELTVEQKSVLAPLSDDWDSLAYFRQKKWLGIAEHFSTLPPLEQRRIQMQMQQWGKLSDEQRQQARETFISAKQLPADQKQALQQKWEEYSNLPQEEKAKLRERALQHVNKSLSNTSLTPPLAAASPPAADGVIAVDNPPHSTPAAAQASDEAVNTTGLTKP